MSVSKTALLGFLLFGSSLLRLLFDEPITADAEERSDPVPEGEESTEKTDES